jgi:hypothetical protein
MLTLRLVFRKSQNRFSSSPLSICRDKKSEISWVVNRIWFFHRTTRVSLEEKHVYANYHATLFTPSPHFFHSHPYFTKLTLFKVSPRFFVEMNFKCLCGSGLKSSNIRSSTSQTTRKKSLKSFPQRNYVIITIIVITLPMKNVSGKCFIESTSTWRR